MAPWFRNTFVSSTLLLLLATTSTVRSDSENPSVEEIAANTTDTTPEVIEATVQDVLTEQAMTGELEYSKQALTETTFNFNPDEPNLFDLMGDIDQPWTVFAPNNQAFEDLSVQDQLLITDERFVGHLTRWIGYHLLDVEVVPSDFAESPPKKVTSIHAFDLFLKTDPTTGQKMIETIDYNENDEVESATYAITDEFEAANGWIYVLEEVLRYHMTESTIYDMGAVSPEFTATNELAEKVGITHYTTGPGPVTVIAPTNGAFTNLQNDPRYAPALENDEDLKTILTYHIVPEVNMYMGNVTLGEKYKTANGEHLTVTETGLDGIKVELGDVMFSNGIVIIVEEVLIPPSIQAKYPAVTSDGDAATTNGDNGTRGSASGSTKTTSGAAGLALAALVSTVFATL